MSNIDDVERSAFFIGFFAAAIIFGIIFFVYYEHTQENINLYGFSVPEQFSGSDRECKRKLCSGEYYEMVSTGRYGGNISCFKNFTEVIISRNHIVADREGVLK